MSQEQKIDTDDPDPSGSQSVEDGLTGVIRAGNEAAYPEAGTMRAGEAGSMHDDDKRRWHIEEGTDVIGTCGHKIGEVMDVQDDYLVVEQGFFITHDLYVPKSAVDCLKQDGLHLNVSKHDADEAEWDEEPVAPPPSSGRTSFPIRH
jgi:hypothetical protein